MGKNAMRTKGFYKANAGVAHALAALKRIRDSQSLSITEARAIAKATLDKLDLPPVETTREDHHNYTIGDVGSGLAIRDLSKPKAKDNDKDKENPLLRGRTGNRIRSASGVAKPRARRRKT